jgi:hypothetical protein
LAIAASISSSVRSDWYWYRRGLWRQLVDAKNQRSFSLKYLQRWLYNSFGGDWLWCNNYFRSILRYYHNVLVGIFLLSFTEPMSISIAFLPFPQSHVTGRTFLIVMSVRVRRREPRGAKIAEMGAACKAYHVVATMRLLSWSITRWAWCGVLLEISQRSFIFFRKLPCFRSGYAYSELPMPSLIAPAAEGEGAVFTDRQEVVSR